MALWGLDLDGIVTLSEGRLLEKLGVKPGQLVGQSALEMYRDNADVIGYLRRALAGEHLHFTLQLGGYHFETWYVPITDQRGTMVGTHRRSGST